MFSLYTFHLYGRDPSAAGVTVRPLSNIEGVTAKTCRGGAVGKFIGTFDHGLP